MHVAVPVEAMWRDAEAAIGRAAIELTVRPRYRRAPRTAVSARHQAHRRGADGRTTHHGQDDTAGAFHAAILCFDHLRRHSGMLASTRQAKAGRFTASCDANMSAVSRRRKNATRMHARKSRIRRASRRPNRNRTMCRTTSGSMRYRCCRNRCATTRPMSRGRHWMKIRGARILCWFAAPVGSVRRSRAASAHRRRRQWQMCPSEAAPHGWSAWRARPVGSQPACAPRIPGSVSLP